MLLNILQCTGQSLVTKNYLAEMSIVPRLKNPEENVRSFSNRETGVGQHEALQADLACLTGQVAIPSHPHLHV